MNIIDLIRKKAGLDKLNDTLKIQWAQHFHNEYDIEKHCILIF